MPKIECLRGRKTDFTQRTPCSSPWKTVFNDRTHRAVPPMRLFDRESGMFVIGSIDFKSPASGGAESSCWKKRESTSRTSVLADECENLKRAF